MGVRFIAITDEYDSFLSDQMESSLIVPIKNFVNDAYCLDISNKVKSHQKVKRRKGDFIGAFAVYGYCKDAGNKNRLVPDPYAAHIVRFIYTWKLEGMSMCAIAKKLNAMGVLSPMEYKKSKGEHYTTGFAAGKPAAWSAIAIKRILQNEIYTGTMVQGKSEKINYKLNTIRQKPKEQWERVAQVHAPVVSTKMFHKVQTLLAQDTRASCGEERAHVFHGLLFCGDCHNPLTRRVNKYRGKETAFFICSTRNKSRGCTRHSIAYDDLVRTVQVVLSVQLYALADTKRFFSFCSKVQASTEPINCFRQEMARLCEERNRYVDLKSHLVRDFENGILTTADICTFQKLYEAQYQEIQDIVKKQEQTVQLLDEAKLACDMQIRQWKDNVPFLPVSRRELLEFVNKIHVYEGRRICICLAIKHPFKY